MIIFSLKLSRKLVHYFRDINSINSHLISRDNFSRAQLVVCSSLWQHIVGINTVKSKESFCMRRTMIISHFHILLFQYLSHVNMKNSCGTVALIQSSWKDFDLVQWIRNCIFFTGHSVWWTHGGSQLYFHITRYVLKRREDTFWGAKSESRVSAPFSTSKTV